MIKSLTQHPAFPEAYLWIAGLLYLAIAAPTGEWTICPLSNLGFDHCPGCGLGRSISLFMRGEFIASWQLHPLGLPALVLLIARSINLLWFNKSFKQQNTHGTSNGIIS